MKVDWNEARQPDGKVARVACGGQELSSAVLVMQHLPVLEVEGCATYLALQGLEEAVLIFLSHLARFVCPRTPLLVMAGEVQQTPQEVLHDDKLSILTARSLQIDAMLKLPSLRPCSEACLPPFQHQASA